MEVRNPLKGSLRARQIERAKYCLKEECSPGFKRWFKLETGKTAEKFLKEIKHVS